MILFVGCEVDESTELNQSDRLASLSNPSS